MNHLAIDIETYSSEDLSKVGVYKYAEADDFAVLLFAYSADGEPVEVVDIANGEALPTEVREALTDDKVIKSAFNANFERVCLSRFIGLPAGEYLSPVGWQCTMVHCGTLGLSLSLAGAGEALGLDRQKMTEGKELIKKFCTPDDMPAGLFGKYTGEAWETFKMYCKRDVEVEAGIRRKLSRYPVPGFVWDEYVIDQQINDRGVLVDLTLVRSAIKADTDSRAQSMKEMVELTGVENPNSVKQLTEWLAKNGLVMSSLDKKAVEQAEKKARGKVSRVLALRKRLAKTSIKKYEVMERCVCEDGRARGMFQFYGSRTGRWAGRLVQLQNLPQNHLNDLAYARKLVRQCPDPHLIDTLYGETQDTLRQLVRTAFVAERGKRFIVADFSAIEARVIAWLAGEEWRMKVFSEGGDIYCASASQMFKVPVEKHGINGHLRQKGKIAELALGYGGGKGALTAMGALEMGLTEDELQPLVDAWRGSNPNIVNLWWEVDEAAHDALLGDGATVKGMEFRLEGSTMSIKLPSGRKLYYPNMAVGERGLVYKGAGTNRAWEELETYGPKLVENIVQAIARDLLANGMKKLRQYGIVMHIHDELVIEAGSELTLERACKAMADAPAWADGLLLRADGYETEFYKKD